MTTRKPPSSTPRAAKVHAVTELPVTRAMLLGVRDELRARIDGTNARIDETNARIDETNARIDETNARIDETNARFASLRADVLAEVHRVGTLVEEQEVRNRVVLEVVQGHNARFERLEAGLDEVRGMVVEILQAVKSRPRD